MQIIAILLVVLAVFSLAVNADTESTKKPRRKVVYADRGIEWGPKDTSNYYGVRIMELAKKPKSRS